MATDAGGPWGGRAITVVFFGRIEQKRRSRDWRGVFFVRQSDSSWTCNIQPTSGTRTKNTQIFHPHWFTRVFTRCLRIATSVIVTSHPPKILNTKQSKRLARRQTKRRPFEWRAGGGGRWCDGREGSARGGRERAREGERGGEGQQTQP